MIIVGVHLEDERLEGVRKMRPYLDIGIIIMKEINGTYHYVMHEDTDYRRETFLEINLEKGNYIILPRTIGVCLK